MIYIVHIKYYIYIVHIKYDIYLIYIFVYNSFQVLITCVALQILRILSLYFTTNLCNRGHSFNFIDEDTQV